MAFPFRANKIEYRLRFPVARLPAAFLDAGLKPGATKISPFWGECHNQASLEDYAPSGDCDEVLE